jgi:hypothetical protein
MADITTVQVSQTQTTLLSQSSGTINLASFSLSNSIPNDIGRIGNAGVSNLAARADHAHSAAALLLDGGNF